MKKDHVQPEKKVIVPKSFRRLKRKVKNQYSPKDNAGNTNLGKRNYEHTKDVIKRRNKNKEAKKQRKINRKK